MLIVTDFLYQALNHFEWERKCVYTGRDVVRARNQLRAAIMKSQHTTEVLNIWTEWSRKGTLSSFICLSHALVHVLDIVHRIKLLLRLEQHFLVSHCEDRKAL